MTCQSKTDLNVDDSAGLEVAPVVTRVATITRDLDDLKTSATEILITKLQRIE